MMALARPARPSGRYGECRIPAAGWRAFAIIRLPVTRNGLLEGDRAPHSGSNRDGPQRSVPPATEQPRSRGPLSYPGPQRSHGSQAPIRPSSSRGRPGLARRRRAVVGTRRREAGGSAYPDKRSAAAQNSDRNPNRMIRGSLVLVIRPGLRALMLFRGFSRLAWLKALNISQRDCSFVLSVMSNFLKRAESGFQFPGPMMRFLPGLPNVPVVGFANADGSKYCRANSPFNRPVSRNGFPAQSGRCRP